MLFDIPYFLRKRIEVDYWKYLKVILETEDYVLPNVSAIMLKNVLIRMVNLNLSKIVK